MDDLINKANEYTEAGLEAAFRFGYRLGLSCGDNGETEDDVVRLWKHKREVAAKRKEQGR